MKTRIIHTKIWKDSYFCSLSRGEKLAFLFILTNENINMCGVYELNDLELKLWTGLNDTELSALKEKFQRDNKFIFLDGWVKVLNHDKYNSYGKGDRQSLAYEKELSLIPEKIKEFKNDTSIHTSIYTDPILDINPKSKNINPKTEIINPKTETEELAEFTSELFQRTVKVSDAWSKNFAIWRKVYSLDEIKKALISWKSGGWIWKSDDKDAGDLVLFFRTRNKAGECDYIGQLLNRKSFSSRLAEGEYLTASGERRSQNAN